MEVTIHIPDDLARSLEPAGGDLSRRTLEALAIDGYRSEKLTEEQVRRILGYGTRMQVHGFLKEHGVYLNYCPEDLEQDMQTSRHFPKKEGTMTQAAMDDARLKALFKTALVELLEERKDLLRDVIEETLEDIALTRAIEEGRRTEEVSRAEVISLLEGGN
jgi:hypothetical protein